MEMTPARWRYTQDYCREVFGRQDEHLQRLLAEATAAGLPDIAVSADVGRLLMMLTALTPGRTAVELGTLGGYSGIWIARGLSRRGRLITVEIEPEHARFAARQFERAGLAGRVELRVGAALDVLPALARELGPESVDVLFLDAVKSEYPDYWRLGRPLVAPGGLIMADNALGSGSWWIDDEAHDARRAADELNRLVAGDPDFDAVAIPLRAGLLVGRRGQSGADDSAAFPG